MDALRAYHQVKLSEDSRKYTRFLLPWGVLEYCVAGMGLSSSGDEWNVRSDQALAGTAWLPGPVGGQGGVGQGLPYFQFNLFVGGK